MKGIHQQKKQSNAIYAEGCARYLVKVWDSARHKKTLMENCFQSTIKESLHTTLIPLKRSPFIIFLETIVKNAINDNCLSISWTYNEPTLYFDFARETSLISHRENLKNVYVSNGYMSEESLDETLKFIDAFNIDLKFFDDRLYREICGGKLDIVLDNLKAIHQSGSHLEITTLLINDLNTDEDHIRSICNFVLEELGEEVPIHFSRFFPMHKMSDESPTKIDYLLRAKEIAVDMGIEYVYLGNMPADNNSYCPNCGELLIARERYCNSDKKRIKDGLCLTCGHKLNFTLE